MRVSNLTPVLAAVAAAVAVALPASAAADEVYAPESGVPELFEVADGRFAYVVEGATQPPPEGFGSLEGPLVVEAVPRDGPEIQSLDLGTDERGGAVALYERCGTRSICDLYSYDFATKRERRLAASRRACDERAPRMRDGVLYFARFPLIARNGARLCTGGLFQKALDKPLRRLTKRPYEDFDVAGGTLAFRRSRRLEKLDLEGVRDTRSVDEIRLMRVGRKQTRRVAFARNRANPRMGDFAAGTFLVNVQFDSGFLYWTRATTRSGGPDDDDTFTSDLVRIHVRGAPEREQLQRSGRAYENLPYDAFPEAFEVDGANVYYYFPNDSGRNAYGRVAPSPVFD